MSNLFPAILMLLALIGGVVMGRMEAQWIVADKKINHFLLTLLRFSLATLALIALLPRPIEMPTAAMSLLLMMGAFAPMHRVSLWWARTHLYRQRLPITHLGNGFYDRLWMTLTGKREAISFSLMTATELLISAAMYTQLAV